MPYSSSLESNTLSRRYELPTCLLEVWTERSPLSDWQSQIVAQNLRFRLRLAQGQRVIKGNQQQIANLIEAVTTYCDRWLAQDDFDTLDHAIAVPKLSKLKLSTLQLFDLYESLELCANEFVILPNVVLEVRRLNPNWLKIIAGAIAIIGISIGTIRLISREQPNYQLASSPTSASPKSTTLTPERAYIPRSPSSESRAETNSKITASPIPEIKPEQQISPTPSQSPPSINSERTDKVAIAPESNSISTDNLNSDRQRATNNAPAVSDGITAGRDSFSNSSTNSPQSSRRLETSGKDSSQPAPSIAEASKPSPSSSSAKIALPSAVLRVPNAEIATTTSIKVSQIQSELPSDITTSLVRYIQTQHVTTSVKGTIALNMEISGDRILSISTDTQSSTLKDNNAIAELESLILKWRSPNSVTGQIRLVVQL